MAQTKKGEATSSDSGRLIMLHNIRADATRYIAEKTPEGVITLTPVSAVRARLRKPSATGHDVIERLEDLYPGMRDG